MQEASRLRMKEDEYRIDLESKRRMQEEVNRIDLESKRRMQEAEYAVKLQEESKTRMMNVELENFVRKRKLQNELALENDLKKSTLMGRNRFELAQELKAKKLAAKQAEEEAQYVSASKVHQAKIENLFQKDSIPKLSIEPMQPGYLEAYLEAKNLWNSRSDKGRYKTFEAEALIDWDASKYSLEMQNKDVIKTLTFFFPPYWADAYNMLDVVEAYRAVLRIMSNPRVK